jgi:hypothetical protein
MADVLDDDGVDDALRRILEELEGIYAAARAIGDDALEVFADATRARVWRALQRRSEDGER